LQEMARKIIKSILNEKKVCETQRYGFILKGIIDV